MNKTIILDEPSTASLSNAQLSEELDLSLVKIPSSSPREIIHQEFSISHIKIDYSRPSIGLSKRKIFGHLVPFDQLWRTGANGVSKITFGQHVKIGGQFLPKGEYAFYTIPTSSGKWKIIFSDDKELFMKDTENGVPKEVIKLETEAEFRHQNKTIETFSIGFSDLKEEEITVWLAWENTEVFFKVEIADSDIVMKLINALIQKGGKENHLYIANFYIKIYNKHNIKEQECKKIEEAIIWLDNLTEDDHWYWYLVKAKLYLLLENREHAFDALLNMKLIAEKMKHTGLAFTLINELKKEIDDLEGNKGKFI